MRTRWAGNVIRMRREEKNVQVLVGKTEGKRLPGRPGRRWEDEIRMDLRETGWVDGVDSVGSGYGQVTGSCKCADEPSCSTTAGLSYNSFVF
jgi:hypothetical protein